ncbi:hypothetical protein B0T20DRAFT_425390 [Sordaria brevicollis]|uniref:Uncharacterized protein n=1 Tax=Sordaria brevicollis TaxID=83679 RepID=A0AAE0NWU5_SORBR|nr:hypothetical protein B0T20DRAFT_425390 [Sordaria brevicollis]
MRTLFSRPVQVASATIRFIPLPTRYLQAFVAILVAAIKQLHPDKDLSYYHFGLVCQLTLLHCVCSIIEVVAHRVMYDWQMSTDCKLPLKSFKPKPKFKENCLRIKTHRC